MSPEIIGPPDAHGAFPWWLLGFLVAAPVSILVGLLLAIVLVWQRKRIQLWAWRVRGRFR